MTHPASLAEIGRACGISKQAVAKHVDSGALIRAMGGQVDIEYLQNRQWLIDREADMTVFYGKEAPSAAKGKRGQAPQLPDPGKGKGTPAVPAEPLKRRNQFDPPPAEGPADPGQINIRRATEIQKYLNLKSDNTIKEMKILEGKNALFEKKVVQNVVCGIMSEIINALMSTPQKIVDNLMNLRITHAESEREEIVRLLENEYIHEVGRVSAAMKKKIAAMRNENPEKKEEEKKDDAKSN